MLLLFNKQLFHIPSIDDYSIAQVNQINFIRLELIRKDIIRSCCICLYNLELVQIWDFYTIWFLHCYAADDRPILRVNFFHYCRAVGRIKVRCPTHLTTCKPPTLWHPKACPKVLRALQRHILNRVTRRCHVPCENVATRIRELVHFVIVFNCYSFGEVLRIHVSADSFLKSAGIKIKINQYQFRYSIPPWRKNKLILICQHLCSLCKIPSECALF